MRGGRIKYKEKSMRRVLFFIGKKWNVRGGRIKIQGKKGKRIGRNSELNNILLTTRVECTSRVCMYKNILLTQEHTY